MHSLHLVKRISNFYYCLHIFRSLLSFHSQGQMVFFFSCFWVFFLGGGGGQAGQLIIYLLFGYSSPAAQAWNSWLGNGCFMEVCNALDVLALMIFIYAYTTIVIICFIYFGPSEGLNLVVFFISSCLVFSSLEYKTTDTFILMLTICIWCPETYNSLLRIILNAKFALPVQKL